METWKTIYNDALGAAKGLHGLLQDLVKCLDQGSIKPGEGPNGEYVPAPTVVTEKLWDFLSKRQRNYARLAYGMCGPIRHAWIIVELTEENLGLHNLSGEEVVECTQCLALPVQWIIDPCALDVAPQVLLISPDSPMKLLYKETR
jgi:hypothetical protein